MASLVKKLSLFGKSEKLEIQVGENLTLEFDKNKLESDVLKQLNALNDPETAVFVAEQLISHDHGDIAFALLNQTRIAWPKNFGVGIRCGEVAFSFAPKDAQRLIWTELRKRFLGQAKVETGYAKAIFQHGDTQNARSTIEQLLTREPDYIDAWQLLLEIINAQLELDESTSKGWLDLKELVENQSYTQESSYAYAVAILRRLVAITHPDERERVQLTAYSFATTSTRPETIIELFHFATQMKHWEKAIQYGEPLLDDFAENILEGLFNAYLHQRKVDDAIGAIALGESLQLGWIAAAKRKLARARSTQFESLTDE